MAADRGAPRLCPRGPAELGILLSLVVLKEGAVQLERAC